MSLYLIAYDVRSNRRRQRVARLLEGYGNRIQYSVFEAVIEPEDLKSLRRDLGAILDHDDDLEIIPIDRSPQRTRYRWQRDPPNLDGIVML